MCLDVDDTLRQTYGYLKQAAGYGYTGVKRINALIATIRHRGRAGDRWHAVAAGKRPLLAWCGPIVAERRNRADLGAAAWSSFGRLGVLYPRVVAAPISRRAIRSPPAYKPC